VDEAGMSAGLAALGFWIFMAVLIIVSVWASVRKREMQLELVRRMIESGQKIDQEMLDRIFPPRAAARNAGFFLVILGIFIVAIGLAAIGADINYPTVALGAFSFLSGAFVWIKDK
jgi:hypothetical protein